MAALQLVGALAFPRSIAALEYPALEGIEPFNTTFADAHMAQLEGPVTEATSELVARATGNVYVCINSGFQPACSLLHWTNDQCGMFSQNS